MRLDYLFHDAFRHTPEGSQAGTLLVHRAEEPSTLGIDESDFAEIYDDGLVRRVILHGAPASLQFVHPGARQSSFHIQSGGIRRIVSRNLQHE